MLNHADEGYVVPIDDVDELRKVHERSAEAVDFVDHDDVNAPWKLKEPKQAAQLAEFLQQSTDPICDTILADLALSHS